MALAREESAEMGSADVVAGLVIGFHPGRGAGPAWQALWWYPSRMEVRLNIPDEIAKELLASGKDPARVVLEAIALEGYRTDTLTEYQIKVLLGFDHRLDVHAFLKSHNVPLNYGVEEYEKDLAVVDEIVAKVEAERAAGKFR